MHEDDDDAAMGSDLWIYYIGDHTGPDVHHTSVSAHELHVQIYTTINLRQLRRAIHPSIHHTVAPCRCPPHAVIYAATSKCMATFNTRTFTVRLLPFIAFDSMASKRYTRCMHTHVDGGVRRQLDLKRWNEKDLLHHRIIAYHHYDMNLLITKKNFVSHMLFKMFWKSCQLLDSRGPIYFSA